jgi:5-methylthioadenosine/S-adenosylhomocysteine deaminase
MKTKQNSINHVMIEGNWIMYDRKILTINEAEMNEEYKKILNQVYET